MLQFWKKINHRTRYQVSLRVLPVVMASVLILGFSSWVLFEHKTLTTASNHQQQELKQLSAGLQFQLTRLAMSAELRKSEICHNHKTQHTSDESCQRDIGEGIIGLAEISATAQIGLGAEGSPSVVFSSKMENEANSFRVKEWIRSHKFPWVNKGISKPAVLNSDPWHQIMIFPAISLEDKTELRDLGQKKSVRVHLPVLIQQKTNLSDNQPNSNDSFTLLMVDLSLLVAGMPTPEWMCLVAENGTIILQQAGAESDFFAGKSGEELLAMRNELQNRTFQRGLVGRWKEPWMVAATQSPVLPLTLFSAHPANDLRVLILRYLTFVIGVTTLALFGSIFGIMRVMKRVTHRMDELADSMSALAKGDYSRRLPEGQWDEIGQLTGYFNLMAASLDEAHREVKEKTVHLKTALENMRMLDQAKDDFLVLISHEVRTPLTAIMGGVDFLKATIKKTSEDEKEILDRLSLSEIVSIIQNSGQRLNGFMNDAIQMTAIQSTDRKLTLKPNPVADLVKRGLSSIKTLAAERGITVENRLHEQLWSVLGDSELLEMAFAKVLKNALDHNRDGGRILIQEAWDVPGQGSPGELLEPEVVRQLFDQPTYRKFEDEEMRWRLIEVFNTGEPIPAKRRKALFGKFELVGPIQNHNKGSGLSLPIAQGAVQCHGGRILLHSDNKDGNSFYLLLPTLLDESALSEALAENLRDDANQCISSTSGNKKVCKVADLASLKVEVDDPGATVGGSGHQSGSGINRPGSSNDQEKVTISRSRK